MKQCTLAAQVQKGLLTGVVLACAPLALLAHTPVGEMNAVSVGGPMPIAASTSVPRQEASNQPTDAVYGARLTLAQMVQQALPRQARIRLADAGVRASQAQANMAQSQLRPNISLSASHLKNDLDSSSPNLLGQLVSSSERYVSENQTLTVRQPLYRPALTAGIRSAQAQTAASIQQREVELNITVSRLSEAYFDHLIAQSQLKFADTQFMARRDLIRVAELALKAGLGTSTEVLEARAKQALAAADRSDARIYVQSTQRQIELLLDVQLFPPLYEPQPIEPDKLISISEQNPQHWVEKALRASPELALLRAKQLLASEEISRSQAGHKPTVDLLIQRSRSGNENVTRLNSAYTNNSLGVQLNIPIYSGGFVDQQVALAQAEYEKASYSFDAAKLELATRVLKEVRSLSESIERHRAASAALTAAVEVLKSVKMGVVAGVRSEADLANADLQVAAADLEKQKNLIQALSARFRLELMAAENEAAVMAALAGTEDWFRR